MKYKFGFDLGSTSLGWCVLGLDNDGNVISLEDMGVRIFPDGREADGEKNSLASVRSQQKQSRIQFDRKIDRRQNLLACLQNNQLLPEDKDLLKYWLNPDAGNKGKTDPYFLRDKSTHEKVSLYELGRIFWSLSKHRGFQGKKDQNIDDKKENKIKDSDGKLDETEKEVKDVNKRIDVLRKDIKKNDCQTFGQYLWIRKQQGLKLGFKGLTKKDQLGDQKDFMDGFPSRQLYNEEFDFIWNKQTQFYPTILTDKLKEELRDKIIYFQRCLKKKIPGMCKFEQTEERIAKCQSLYQKFRILQNINNLKYGPNNENKLDNEQKQKLFNLLNTPWIYGDILDSSGKKISFDVIRYHIFGNHAINNVDFIFNFEKDKKNGLLCNYTNIVMNKILGELWNPEDDNYEIIKKLTAYYESRFETEKYIKDVMNISDDAIIKKLLKIKLTSGFSELSKTAIEKLFPDMKKGQRYDEVAEKIYGSHSVIKPFLKAGYNPLKELPKYQKLFPESLSGDKISNITVHIALNQIRLVVNSLIKKYSLPEEIAIELARDLKMSKKELNNYKKNQDQNELNNLKMRLAIKEAKADNGYEPTNLDIEKYKIWVNMAPYDFKNGKEEKAQERIDLYDPNLEKPKVISLIDALSSEYEIEHIIPRALGGDDTIFNKVLTNKKYNFSKLNKIPATYLSNALLDRAKKWAKMLDDYNLKKKYKENSEIRKKKEKEFNFCSRSWRFESDALIHIQNLGFKARDLNDTRYMSKLSRDYLSYICKGYTKGKEKGFRNPKVLANNGSLTSLFRSVWRINDVLPNDLKNWEIQKWQKDLVGEKIKENLLSGPNSLNYIVGEDADKNNKKKLKENLDNDIKKELEKIDKSEFYKIKPKKDRTNHYHHALDAFVVACLTKSINNEINSMADYFEEENEIYNKNHDEEHQESLFQTRKRCLKNSDKFNMPFSKFNKNELQNKISNIIVSRKQKIDKLEQCLKSENPERVSYTSVAKDTAYGLYNLEINDGKIKVYASKKKPEAKSLSSLVPVFNKKHENYKTLRKEYIEAYSNWHKNTKDKEMKEKLLSCITKDKIFKWLESDGNYAAEIYTSGKNWNVESISNWWAFQRKGRFFWRDENPNAKFVMKLRIDDIVCATFKKDSNSIKDNMEKYIKNKMVDNDSIDLLFRVKKISGTTISLTPIHIACEDHPDTKTWNARAKTLKDTNLRKVEISPLGEFSFEGSEGNNKWSDNGT